VRLLFGLDLQPMLDPAQKPIRFVEVSTSPRGSRSNSRRAAQGLEHTRFLKKRMMRSVD
jgi:hypothetical protein